MSREHYIVDTDSAELKRELFDAIQDPEKRAVLHFIAHALAAAREELVEVEFLPDGINWARVEPTESASVTMVSGVSKVGNASPRRSLLSLSDDPLYPNDLEVLSDSDLDS